MNTTVSVFPGITPMIMAIISLIIYLFIIGIGIYLILLLIKALKTYIKKNS